MNTITLPWNVAAKFINWERGLFFHRSSLMHFRRFYIYCWLHCMGRKKKICAICHRHFLKSFFLCSKLKLATWVSLTFGSHIHANMVKAPEPGKFYPQTHSNCHSIKIWYKFALKSIEKWKKSKRLYTCLPPAFATIFNLFANDIVTDARTTFSVLMYSNGYFFSLIF